MADGPKHLATEIPPLDEQLGGGIPKGAIVTTSGDPGTQSEMFLHKIMDGQETLYISNVSNEEASAAEFAKSRVITSEPTIKYANPDAPIQDTRKFIEKLNEHRLIVIEGVNVLEDENIVNRGNYQRFINFIQNLIRRTGGIVILHRYNKDNPQKNSYITDAMSDIILNLEEEYDGDELKTYLKMPKVRGGVPMEDRMALNLGASISVDTSRDIA